ncbi:MAG: hypothetical protein EPN39_11440 [Chitinophagaceae bacterium]|jgi:hypothetical protein|nr:MAG: hypothetical protein EPN39_11440 [Chitinophagaceae bacterium]
MQEYIDELQQKAGLTEEQAKQAIDIIVNKVKSKVPETFHSAIDNLFAGQTASDALKQKYQDFSDQASEKLQQFGKEAQEQLNEAAKQATDFAKEMSDKAKDFWKKI